MRPEYVKCIRQTRAEKESLSWCGQNLDMIFAFTNIDHAVYNTQQGGRLVACPECVKAIIEILSSVTV